MTTTAYRNHFITVVCHYKDATAQWTPSIEICWKGDGLPDVTVLIGKSFGNSEEAENTGFVIGQRWVDDFLVADYASIPPAAKSTAHSSGHRSRFGVFPAGAPSL